MTAAHLGPAFYAFAGRWLPAPPARILDVGCGAGESTRWLADQGFEALGLDPEAPPEPGFRRGRIEDLEAPGEFDAALAIRSLHHVDDLQAAVAALARALAPRARLVLFEFAIEAVDAEARRWCAEHGLPRPTSPESAHDVIPLAELRPALEARFRPLADEPVPYLAREGGRPQLEPRESSAIAAGRIAPAGARLAYERA